MQCTGKDCVVCEGRIVAEIEASGCVACNLAVHDKCLKKPGVCPLCNKSFADVEEEQKKAVQAGGFFGPEKKALQWGMAGGLLMMVIAGVWFFAGLAFDRIFFYPPVLFLIGLYGVLKGLVTGNIAGKN